MGEKEFSDKVLEFQPDVRLDRSNGAHIFVGIGMKSEDRYADAPDYSRQRVF
jgi:hypothetical protein